MKKANKIEEPDGKLNFLFTRDNFMIMGAGIILIILGYLLLMGGGSKDRFAFNEAIFDTQRLVVAPLLLLIGYSLQFIAIFYKKPQK